MEELWHRLAAATWWKDPAWLTAIFTALYLLVTYRLFLSTRRYNEASTRPFMRITVGDPQAPTFNELHVTVEFENIGRLPASAVHLRAHAHFDGPRNLHVHAPGPHDAFPEQRFWIGVKVPDDLVTGVNAGTIPFGIDAEAAYRGITGKKHKTTQTVFYDALANTFNVTGGEHS